MFVVNNSLNVFVDNRQFSGSATTTNRLFIFHDRDTDIDTYANTDIFRDMCTNTEENGDPVTTTTRITATEADKTTTTTRITDTGTST